MAAYEEKRFRSRDGLSLYFRDYAGRDGAGPCERVPVLCLHGLTRNCKDFESLATHLAARRRVITPDQRGRGASQYDSTWTNYHPGVYVEDMWTLLSELALERVIVVGTSMGGLMAMLMAATRPQAVAAIVLNDVGPEIDPAGAARIQSYVGRLPPVRNWNDAAAQMRTTFGTALPDYTEQQWQQFARLSFVEGEDGVPRLAADPKIGDAVRTLPVPPGATAAIWMAFRSLAAPMLAIRGEHSDILSADTFDRMQREVPSLTRVTVPNRGHPPQLDEPESLAAIDRFIDGLAA
jgi:pimeloyl-ACP methyl ester carboxylesterase